MKLLIRLYIVLLVVLSVSCSEESGPGLGDHVELDLGQSTSFSGVDLTAKFEGVVGDSRCPTGAVCVWEGNAEILLRVKSGDLEETYSLNTTLDPKQVDHDGFQIELVTVEPYPVVDEEISADDYSIIISVVK